MQMYNGMTNRQRAQVLVEALPYIQKYNGKSSSSSTAATP